MVGRPRMLLASSLLPALCLCLCLVRADLSHTVNDKLSFENTAIDGTATSVTFTVTYKGAGWFGLGMGGPGGGMSGSDMVICTQGNTVAIPLPSTTTPTEVVPSLPTCSYNNNVGV